MNPVRASMVVGPRQYRWSSYRERIGLVGRSLLDKDASYLALADDEALRIERYKAYLKQKSIEINRVRVIDFLVGTDYRRLSFFDRVLTVNVTERPYRGK
ncbi:hypothetical protein [Sedimenticola sp.]|uniref:hypothetical protein n=1 Tax=Sedimenticola sp. TaxID=1940285 RepID=UPI003D13AAB1